MRRSCAAVLLLATAGCVASVPPAGRTDPASTRVDLGDRSLEIQMTTQANISSATVAASPAELWPALVTVYGELGLQPTGADSRNRVLQVAQQRVRRIENRPLSTFLDCGSGNAGQYANLYDVFVGVQTNLLPGPEPGTTSVRTQFEAQVRDGAHGSAPIRCTSRQVLEARIIAALRNHAAGEAPSGGGPPVR